MSELPFLNTRVTILQQAVIDLSAEIQFKHRLKLGSANVLIGLTIIAILVIAGAWNKPVWIDEVLHFAMGEMSFIEALQTIDYTTFEINHGQTGFYMLVDWALLKIFGASSIALRLPSLFFAFVLMWAAVILLRNRGLNGIWQWLVLIALVASPTWVWYVGEARPYIPLAASAIALAAFYSASPDQRATWSIRIIGSIGLIGGALMHPYWIYFVCLFFCFGILVAWSDQSWPPSLRALWRYSGGWLLIAALSLFLIVGQLTWMRRVRSFWMDPFESFGSPQGVWDALIRTHVTGYYSMLWLILGVSAIAVLMFVRPFKRLVTVLLPLLMVLLGILSSIVVSYLSWLRDYWILERQWVGGIAISIVGLVWLFGALWDLGENSRFRWRQWPSALFAVLIALSAFTSVRGTLDSWPTWSAEQAVFAADTRTPEELFADYGDGAAVYAANVNISRGGKVWPIFTDWYWKQAGMRPEFREDNPGWTRWFVSEPVPGSSPR